MARVIDRAARELAAGGVFETGGELITLTANTYFSTAWLAEDGSTQARVLSSRNVALYDPYLRPIDARRFALRDFDHILIVAVRPSTRPGDTHLKIAFLDAAGQRTWGFAATYDAYQIDLLADFDRDGVVDAAQPRDAGWQWGAGGTGAVLLVNSDRDTAYPSSVFRDRLDRELSGPLDLEDMTPLVVAISGPKGRELSDCTVRLHVSEAAASRLRAFDVSRTIAEVAIGPGMPTAVFPAAKGRRRLAVEGLDYPDVDFSGLITIAADIERDGEVLGGTEIVLRVAPWLGLPNTQPVERLMIAEMSDGSNANAIRDMAGFAAAAGIELERLPPSLNRGDRWLQDEIEIGYAASTRKSIPVVLDSPRNRGLDHLPEAYLLGPDFGYVTRGNDQQTSSLDSFGNLDCTPPHSAPHGDFPFGRILFGGAAPGGAHGRRMMKVVRDFTIAQVVQQPLELWSDWLAVGHIDEFMGFVPASDALGFRLVLASPDRALLLLRDLAARRPERLWLMGEWRERRDVRALLADGDLVDFNWGCQRAIDWNRNLLVAEMGLAPGAIVEVPTLYTRDSDGRAGALFPNAANLQVANGQVAVPKPFGPKEEGRCIFEAAIRDAFDPLGLTTHFIDTFEGYFLARGEIHCGTNVVRTPFRTKPWWEFEPRLQGRPGSRIRL